MVRRSFLDFQSLCFRMNNECEDTPVDQQLRAKDAEITSLKRELQALQMRLAQAQAHNAASNPNNSNGHSAPGNTDSALVKAAASPNASSVTRRPCHSDLFGVVEILSVDDHPVNQMVIENIVASMEGYKVRWRYLYLVFHCSLLAACLGDIFYKC